MFIMLTGTLKVKHIDFKNLYHQFCVGGNFFLHLSNHPDVGAQKDIDPNIHLKKKVRGYLILVPKI